MIVDRAGQRHQDRRQPRCRQFADRERARATDDQVRPRIGRAHIGDETLDAGLHTLRGVAVCALGLRCRTALMDHLGAGVRADQPERLGENLVQHAGTLTAAEHEQTQSAARASGKALGRRRQRGNRGTHRVADEARKRISGERPGQPEKDRACNARQQPVGGACHSVLLVHHQRHAEQACRKPARTGDEAAGSQHAGGAKPPDDGCRLQDGCHEEQGREQFLQHLLATDTAHAQV